MVIFRQNTLSSLRATDKRASEDCDYRVHETSTRLADEWGPALEPTGQRVGGACRGRSPHAVLVRVAHAWRGFAWPHEQRVTSVRRT